ncbi:hypothetical protein P9273_14790 [Mesorhizobium sp. WSM4935]|uniref:hypothetical protein n=1 Tax=Mesorhizobium sp. WSM4935 TaxID=3038547 RepID=UPI0024151321|nr:hypothetical protein [Mesorhizobium sp. WSM4935]MDG4876360.1 hypothetical protein [Mesorhizobium sp. WSM4935]
MATPTAENKRERKNASVSVVSEVLIPSAAIFIEFDAKWPKRWIPMLNEFPRLPLVLALFSSN